MVETNQEADNCPVEELSVQPFELSTTSSPAIISIATAENPTVQNT